ncbi:MAG: ABC transporter substrate-binding protein [Clostridiales bacterium]|nr:ABC transporter substrate-binding protein [Clostridiales bacterium]
MKKRALSLLMVMAMTVSLVASCGSGSSSESESSYGSDTTESSGTATETASAEGTEDAGTDTTDEIDMTAYTEESQELYLSELGDFYDYYTAAKEAETVSERYALMAIAEAKFLETGLYLPTSANGGYYSMSRVVPYTCTSVLWGNDSYRYATLLITTDFITAEDRTAMKEKWAELKGTGEYYEWAKSYVEEKGYTLKDTYSFLYSSDPQTWDVLATSQSADSEAIINTYDGLMEYNCENELDYALAESYEVSDDGLTYTFHLREDATWVDYEGTYIADVTADDFVAGLQHMMDAQGGLEYLVEGVIKNATEYIYGEVTDFSEVGVEATDDHTVVYTLEEPCSYFLTMLGYGVFAPMCRSYFVQQGGAFGEEWADASASSDYTYGTSPNNIAYCGAYLVSNATSENTITFTANPTYYNADKVTIQTINWYFTDGSDVTKSYNDAVAGTIDGCSLNTSTLQTAKDDGYFDTYVYVSSTDATAFGVFFNINRYSYVNTNDGTTGASSKTDEQKEASKTALLNDHFRLAICYSIDREAYNAQATGEDVALYSLNNAYTPGNFVYLEEDVTVDINGTETTFEAGTAYGVIVQAQLDADGSSIVAYDPDADDGVGSSTGYDGWYNVDAAVEELNLAIEELAEKALRSVLTTRSILTCRIRVLLRYIRTGQTLSSSLLRRLLAAQ